MDSTVWRRSLASLCLLLMGCLSLQLASAQSALPAEWVQTIGPANSSASGDAVIYSVVADANNHVYATGYFQGTLTVGTITIYDTDGNRFLIKYDSNGNPLWAYAMEGNVANQGDHLAVDASGNVYTMGTFNGTNVDFNPGAGTSAISSGSGNNVFLQKFNSAGVLQWVQNYGGNSNLFANGIAVAADGSIYVVGSYQGATTFGSVSVASSVSNSSDVYVLKVSSAGVELWVRVIGNTGTEAAIEVAVDSNGDVLIFGDTNSGTLDMNPNSGTDNKSTPPGGSSYDVFVQKLTASGGYVWGRRMGGSNTERGYGLALGSDNSIYYTGRFRETFYFDPTYTVAAKTSNGSYDVFLGKLTSSGAYAWGHGFGSSTNDDRGYGVAVDGNGNVYVIGRFNGTVDFDPGSGTASKSTAGSNDAFINAFTTNGVYQWSHALGSTSSEAGYGIDIDGTNSLFVAGQFDNTIDFDPTATVLNKTATSTFEDGFLAKYSSGCTKTFSISPSACGSYTAPDGKTYTTSGTYTAVITDSDGCEVTYTISLTIQSTDSDGDGTPDCADLCPLDPAKTAPGTCGCGVADTDSDGDGTLDCNDQCPLDPAKTAPGTCGCGVADTDTDGDGTADCNDGCPTDPNKIAAGDCGCGVADTDSDGDGTADCADACPNDPNKIAAGDCGCGVADTDTDGDGTADCADACPTDPNKIAAGDCGCGVADTDTDGDGTADCADACPTDPNKIAAGDCGCGVADTDTDGDGTADCADACPTDPNKIAAGDCGCGVADTDTDGDGAADCADACPTDPNKIAAGDCGCGVADTDTDGDGTADCADACPTDPNKIAAGDCGCGVADTDTDGDGTADCNDACPTDPNKIAAGDCGCGVADTDTDGDGTADCADACPTDPNKIAAGDCGCGVADTDTDGDGTADCNDACPTDPNKIAIGDCGCGVADTDTDGDGTADCADACPTDPYKIAAGDCGCGVADTDTDGDGTADCADACPTDPNKIVAGDCGCGVADTDSDGDGTADCADACPTDPNKIVAGDCGCGVADTDSDGDGTADCADACPADPNKIAAGDCGCGVADTDTDGDGTADCADACPTDPNKIAAGNCGCGVADTDTDGDGTLDCLDECPSDPNKIVAGACGCGVADVDSDGDGTLDCDDLCPADADKIAPGDCGCGFPELDINQDKEADCLLAYDPNLAHITSYVWDDQNGNGKQDGFEPGIPDVVVKLLSPTNQVLEQGTTNSKGYINFVDLQGGLQVKLEFVRPVDHGFAGLDQSLGDYNDSDVDPTTSQTIVFTTKAKKFLIQYDAGFLSPGTVESRVWDDTNGNGKQDAGEPGIPGAMVKLLDAGGAQLQLLSTDANGEIAFSDVPADQPVQLEFVDMTGHGRSPLMAVSNPAIDSDADPADGRTALFQATQGNQVFEHVDAGFYSPGTILAYVWNDLNGNGKQDAGETPIAGSPVKLLDNNDQLLQSTVSDGSGIATFTGVPADAPVKLQFDAKSGHARAPENTYFDQNRDSDAELPDGKTAAFQLDRGNGTIDTVDAGFFGPAAVEAYVWKDLDGDGKQDAGETPIFGALVKLLDANGQELQSTVSGLSGFATFTGVPADIPVKLEFVLPANYGRSPANQGANPAADSDAALVDGMTPTFQATQGSQVFTQFDAGFIPQSSGGTSPRTMQAGEPELTVYPVPAASVLTAKITDSKMGAGTFRILDLQGRIVLTGNVELRNGQTTWKIDLSEVDAGGTYHLQVMTEEGMLSSVFQKVE
ncbi:SdrD B-like domain-containing protein [Pontibacter sp. G13]|uniref:SdrD B-like domain-containing protein n=1 Tax=Pontibacter sp. G13 TaxID=3074898 RepID=UPI00288C3FD6|nr:SdrD B-like domain-containing protein [Pontibacter sp. G13]WNJ19462.1 SdrD B-like domain-containing protein [Pontibacter sp. G13]